MIDNISKISSLLNFNDPNDFYFIQILQRKKDFPENTQNVDKKVLRSYYIYSKYEFDTKINDIIKLCQNFSARAYIWLNKRNCKEISLYAIQELARYVKDANCQRAYRVFDHCVGKLPTKGEKYWIIDFDSKDEDLLQYTCKCIDSCISAYRPIVVKTISSKSGYHIITRPFYLESLLKNYTLSISSKDIKKDSPTLLYYGGSDSLS